MSRSRNTESNGGIFIDIACSEPNILTCKVIGRNRSILLGPVCNEKRCIFVNFAMVLTQSIVYWSSSPDGGVMENNEFHFKVILYNSLSTNVIMTKSE